MDRAVEIMTSPSVKESVGRESSRGFKMPADAGISFVELRVRDLGRMLTFYRDALGLTETKQTTSGSELAAAGGGETIVRLFEDRNAEPRASRTTGLFHTAIRFPGRVALAQIFRRLASLDIAFQGFADHGVSEALYLADPEGNGLELYADRPRNQWKLSDGTIQMGTWALDVDALLALGSSDRWSGVDSRTDIGHIHLNVSDLAGAEAFYCDLLGFDVMVRTYSGALFVSAGGYHHHIGLNIWAGRGASRPPEHSTGLMSYGINAGTQDLLSSLKQTLDRKGISFTVGDHQLTLTDQDGIRIHLLESGGVSSSTGGKI